MIACIPERVFPYWRHTIVAIALMEIVTATFFNTGNMGSITHSAAFVAAALAVNSWGFFAIPALFFIVYAKGGTAFAVLVAVLIGRERGAHRVPTFILCVGIGLIAYAMSGGDVFHLSERVSIWRESFDWWRANANPLFGTGLGTFKWISMYKIHPTPPLQLQMHCEWLRILFETGVVGLVLSLAFFGHLIKRAWGNPRILAALAALGVWGLTYNPLSTPVGVLFLGCLVRECLED
jgi:O-antigen ligase